MYVYIDGMLSILCVGIIVMFVKLFKDSNGLSVFFG